MKILLILILSINLLLSSTKKSNAVGVPYYGLFLMILAQEAMNAMSDDFDNYCYFDVSYLLKPVLGSGGPSEESWFCFGNVTVLALGMWASYTAAYNTTYTLTKAALIAAEWTETAASTAASVVGEVAGVAAAEAAGLIVMSAWLAAAEASYDDLRVCYDTPPDGSSDGKNSTAPFAYTTAQIRKMYYYVNGYYPTNEYVADKDGKICIESTSGAKDFQVWLKKNECVSYDGVTFCAYALKGESSVLCVRTSSTCPCRFPLGKGSENIPQIQASSSGGISYDATTGQFDMGDVSYSNFLTHCRMVSSTDAFSTDLTITNNIIDQACKDGKGSSKSTGVFSLTAPAAECLIGTFRNLFEKKIPLDANYVNVDETTSALLEQIAADEAILSNVLSVMIRYKSSSLMSSISTTTSFDIEDINSVIANDATYTEMVTMLKAMKSNDYSSISSSKQLTLSSQYSDKLSGITSSGFLISSVTTENAVSFYNNMILDINAVNAALLALQNYETDVSQSSVSDVTQTVYGRFQSYFKALIITGVIAYVMIFGFKMINGSGEEEFKVSKIMQHFISIGIVVYFAIGNGWRDYGINILMNASAGVADLMMEVVYLQQKDGCARSAKYFSVDSSLASYPQLTTAQARQYITTSDSNNSLGSANMALIDSEFCESVGGTGKLFFFESSDDEFSYYCLRGPFLPSPNYEIPFLPVYATNSTLVNNIEEGLQEAGIISSYSYNYLPVRCIDEDEQLMRCDTSACKSVGANYPGPPLFAHVDSIGNVDFLICTHDSVTDEMYVADGYHVDDLMAIGYLDSTVAYPTLANGIIGTGFYVGRSNGKYRYPFSSDGTNAFSDRLERRAIKAYVDNYRSELNLNKGTYPIYKTDAGSYRDNSYLSVFDALDCKIEKYISANTYGIPSVIITAIKVAFSSLIGFMIAIVVLTHTAMLIVVCLKVAQNYIVGMMYLVLYIYISPVTIPCLLFDITTPVWHAWKKGLMSYIIYPPSTFILIVLVMKITDTIMYTSSDGSYDYSTLFNSDGTISDSCQAATDGSSSFTIENLKNTPYACIVHKMEGQGSSAAIAFFAVWICPVVPVSLIIGSFALAGMVSTFSETQFYYTMFLKSLMVLISMSISMELIDKFEGTLKSMLGGGDLGVKGGLGNLSSTVNPMKIAKTTASGAKGLADAGRNVVEAAGRYVKRKANGSDSVFEAGKNAEKNEKS